jgi:hypothetical protein
MTTAAKDIAAILDTIPRREQERVNEGQTCTPFLPASVDEALSAMIADDGRARATLPRLTDIYRHLINKGIEILKTMSVDEIIASHKKITEPCRKAQCGFDKETNLDLFLLRNKADLFDYQIRRLALKIGFERVFG